MASLGKGYVISFIVTYISKNIWMKKHSQCHRKGNNMIGKFALLVCLFGLARAGNLYGGGPGYSSLGFGSLGYGSLGHGSLGYGSLGHGSLGYGSGYGYGGYGYGHDLGYSAPIVTKTVGAPVVKTIAPISYAHAPAISHVSQYSYHGSPIVKSYAPLGYASYGHGYSHGGYGYGGYGW
ncbi:chorion class B protein B.L1-like [Cydia strobilella]|uniref:chorion class B protein B.L1-like n=1 Tax=Cydia strobilella TaxID=1100964 RepID=UPI0030059082